MVTADQAMDWGFSGVMARGAGAISGGMEGEPLSSTHQLIVQTVSDMKPAATHVQHMCSTWHSSNGVEGNKLRYFKLPARFFSVLSATSCSPMISNLTHIVTAPL